MTSTFPRPTGPDGTSTDATASASDVSSGSLRIGVLSPHNSKETKAILNAVRALGHEPVWIRDENVTSRIEDGQVRLAPEVDVLVNRLLLTKSDQHVEDLKLAALYGDAAPVLNDPDAVADTIHKFRAAATLAAADVPVPDAYLGRSPETIEEWSAFLPDRAAQKRTIGTNGEGMARLSPDEPVGPRIDGAQSFVQEFIDSPSGGPSDLRVYVVDDAVVGAMRRHAPDDEWRTNVALGAEVERATSDLGRHERDLAVAAVDALGLDVAGVDLMELDGRWTVLEVNATAGFKGLYEATGVSVAPHIARLAVERGGGSVPDEAVTDLESTLDDSVPECKPERRDTGGEEPVIGYTTRVRIAGSNGTRATVAKSDTGAKRTSIDTDLAGDVGLGPLVGTTKVRSVSSGGSTTRPLVEVDIRLEDGWRTVTASITDRSRMEYPVLLGRDVLAAYTLDVTRTAEE